MRKDTLESDMDVAAQVGASANSYDVNITPSATADYLLGIDDFGEGSWAVQRFNIANLKILFSVVTNVTDATDAPAISAAEASGTQITNQGWDFAHDQVITLLDISANDGSVVYKFTFINVEDSDTGAVQITPDASSLIYLNGTIGANGEYVQVLTPEIGDGIVCESASLDGSTSDWFCYTIQGAWVAE